jgi:hypothetical protein
MLKDLDDPVAKLILAASRALDAVLIAAREMTVACRKERRRLRAGCDPTFAELRQLAREHFAGRAAIPPAINELERLVGELAEVGAGRVPEDGPAARFRCPACRAWLCRMSRTGCWAPFRPVTICCLRCLARLVAPRRVLESIDEGFGTDAI